MKPSSCCPLNLVRPILRRKVKMLGTIRMVIMYLLTTSISVLQFIKQAAMVANVTSRDVLPAVLARAKKVVIKHAAVINDKENEKKNKKIKNGSE
jgi:hypothetical protein